MNFVEAVIAANEEIALFLRSLSDDSYFYPNDETSAGIGFGGDRSLKIDLAAEQIFVERLRGFGRINSEECGVIGEGEYTVVIDPIDGSSNISAALPYYGTSVALKTDYQTIASVVCNLPNGECFVKEGGETYRRFLFSTEKLGINRALRPLVGIFERAYANPKAAKLLREKHIKFRSPGALAISLAYAHSVRFVLAIGKLREYDIIAGLHLNEDLCTHLSERLLIISKDRAIFEQLVTLFAEGDQ